MLKTYSFLIGAIFCEVAGTMLLPVSQNLYRPVATGEEDMSDVQNGYSETLRTSNR